MLLGLDEKTAEQMFFGRAQQPEIMGQYGGTVALKAIGRERPRLNPEQATLERPIVVSGSAGDAEETSIRQHRERAARMRQWTAGRRAARPGSRQI
jgi:hypothetical protein